VSKKPTKPNAAVEEDSQDPQDQLSRMSAMARRIPALVASGNVGEAIRLGEDMTSMAIAMKWPLTASSIMSFLGAALFNANQFDEAERWLRRSIEIRPGVAKDGELFVCVRSLGDALLAQSKYQAALQAYQEALDCVDVDSAPEQAARVLNQLGYASRQLGNMPEAVSFYERSIALRSKHADTHLVAVTLHNLAFCFARTGSNAEAIECYQEAIHMREQLGHVQAVLEMIEDVRELFRREGRTTEALACSEHAYELARKTGLREQAASAAHRLAQFLLEQDKYDEALKWFNEELEVTQIQPTKAGALEGIAAVYSAMNNYSKSREYARQALRILSSLGDEQGLAATLNALAVSYRKEGQFEEAKKYYIEALRVAISPDVKAYVYANLSHCLCRTGEYAAALKHIELAEANVRECREQGQLGVILSTKAEILRKLGRVEDALNVIDKAFQHPGLASVKRWRAAAYANRGLILRELGRLIEAKDAFVEAVSETESLREAVPLTHDERARFLTEFTGRYHRLLHTQWLLGEHDQAWRTLEACKSRASLEAIRGMKVAPVQDGPVEYKKVRELLESVGDVALVEYCICQHEDVLLVFTATKDDRRPRVIARDIEYQQLRTLIRELCNGMMRALRGSMATVDMAPLSEVLLEPIEKELGSCEAVWLIPHDILHNLPLHAMEANGSPLGHSHGVFYSTSASLLLALSEKERIETRANLVVSCPRKDDEPFLRDLIIDGGRELARILGTEPIEYNSATKECVVESLRKGYDNVVFLCHGSFNPRDPLLSGIELAKGEVLSARDILALHIQANLVTVAACESGIRQYLEGDEFIGIPQSLLRAGARNTLTTLWAVAAQPTVHLLMDFFRMAETGTTKLSALKAAQVAAASFHRDVWLWAPFVLHGTGD